ncbi:MAG: DNA polymerase III subunit alpha, partial [Chloroflexi bacterium]|nr:DNA polymerase III subunit alpha [Chloroflexota bacterium]
HYTLPGDAEAQDLLLCIQTGSSVMDEKRMRMNAPVYYVQSEAEVRARFAELPEAVDNTQRIAELCDLELEFDRLHLPDVDVPSGVSPDEHLANLAQAGLERRYEAPNAETRRRLQYELDVVRETGFANYILVVYDFAQFARRNGIAMGVRGSAAASLILYCLDVTDVDPLAYGLVFERFLNVERKEMPDIDMDFADDRREEMITYVAQKYGYDHVAQIITFGTLGAKAAIRDVGRVLGMSYGDTDRIARLVPSALNMTIERALEESPELRAACDADGQVQRLVDKAKRLEGVARHASTHAAGIVISREPLVEHVPLQRPARGESDGVDQIPTTQYAMEQVAQIGLLKLDLLGLVNLTILGRTAELIRESRGVEIDVQQLPDGDAKTYEMLSRGETFGVFQLESAGMRRAVQDLRPESIADLSALVALYRPGPIQHIPTFCRAKHGLQKITYPHPDLANMLDETYGVITYQDQVLLIAQKFAGYTLGEADVMRKAMGKKIPAAMRAERDRFVRGAKRKRYSEGEAQEIFELILPFAGYAFNKAHAVCYAMIAYRTAYLKANYPAEYMTAVLMFAGSHPAGAHPRIAAAAADCARLGIAVLPPDVNSSEANFSLQPAEDGAPAIRFGLQQIKNVGAGAAESIVAERTRGGPFASIEDFSRRISVKSVNKRALESLAKSGALAAFGDRGTLLANLERLVSLAQREQRLRESGQATMFDLFGDQVSTPMPGLELEQAPVPRAEELAWEKELLGVYVSDHPFKEAAGALAGYATAVCAEFASEAAQTSAAGGATAEGETPEGVQPAALPPQGREATLAGMVGNTRRLYTRDSRPFCAAEIEDLSGAVEVTIWPELFERTQDIWIEGNIVLMQVRARERNGRLQIAVQQVELYQSLDGAHSAFVPPSWLVREQREQGTSDLEAGRGTREAGRTPQSAAPPEPAATPQPAPAPVSARADQKPAASVATAARATLRVELRETEDEDADRERLEQLLAVLRDAPGEDEVRLTVHTLGGESHPVVLGKLRVQASAELAARLADVLSD